MTKLPASALAAVAVTLLAGIQHFRRTRDAKSSPHQDSSRREVGSTAFFVSLMRAVEGDASEPLCRDLGLRPLPALEV